MERFILDISWRSIWRVFLGVVLVAVLILAHQAVLSIALALVISVALDPLVSFLERHRFPRLLGTLLVYIFILLVLAFIFYSLVPVALIELSSLVDNLGIISEKISGTGLAGLLTKINAGLENYLEIFLKGGRSLFSTAVAIFGGVISGLVSIVATAIISFYLTVSKNGWERFLRVLAPNYYEGHLLRIIERSRIRIGRWFSAQIILSLVVGIIIFIGLWLFGVKYALLLALVAAVFEIVPIVGPIFAGVLAVLVASTDSLLLAVYIAVFYLVVQQLESQVFVPLVMRRILELHPVLVLSALMIGSQVAGFWGLILAVPTAVVIQEIFADFARRKPEKLKIDND